MSAPSGAPRPTRPPHPPRPPRFLEALLDRVVSPGLAGESAVGDLAERYARRRADRSRLATDLWYAAQVATVGAHRLVRGPRRGVFGGATGSDLRHALRSLVRRPAFSVGVLVTLGLGIGANGAVVRVLDGTLEATSWWSDPGRAFSLWPERLFSRGELWMFADQAPEGLVVGGYRTASVSLAPAGAEPVTARSVAMTPALFQSLRVQPALGRGLTPADAEPGAEPVVVLGNAWWRERLGADPDVLGRRVEVNGAPHTVVGVQGVGGAAPGVRTELWTPLVLDPNDPEFFPEYDVQALAVAPAGMGAVEVQAELRRFTAGMAERFSFFYPPDFGQSATVVSAESVVRDSLRTPLLLLLGATLVLLLVAALNAGNLLLARSVERSGELAVRRALGADRGRIVRQLAVEGGILAVFATALGVALATPAASALAYLFPADVPAAEGAWGSARVATALLVTTAAVWFVVTAVPALHFLRADARGVRPALRGGAMAPRGLVGLQAAAATVLLVTAVLLVGSIRELRQIPTGFDAGPVVVAHLPFPESFVGDRGRLREVQSLVVERMAALPGVEAAGLTSSLPLSGVPMKMPVNPESDPVEVSEAVRASRVAVGPGWFDAMGLALRSGRAFGPAETTPGVTAVVVNESLARALWGEGDAVNRLVAVDPHAWDSWVRVVGVVEDARSDGLLVPAPPTFYVALDQLSDRDVTLAVRGSVDAAGVASSLRGVLAEVDGTVPVGDVRSMRRVVRDAYGETWVTMGLLAVLALLATALACAGVYAALSQHVARRRREMGVRLALGAGRGRLVGLVLRSGVLPAVVGAGVGLGVAALATGALRGVLFGVSPLDPRAFVVAALGVVLSASAAALLPAVRAGSVAPAEVMREE